MSREELYRRAILAGASPDDEFTFGPETNDEADEAEAAHGLATVGTDGVVVLIDADAQAEGQE